MNISRLRETAGLTQDNISKKIGISLRAYRQYEKGEREPRASVAVKLAKILNTTVEKIWS